MRFPILAARLALVALALATAIAAAAMVGVRAGMTDFSTGQEIMAGAVAFGGIALMLAVIWTVHALRHNRGEAKRAGMTALIGSLILLYIPLHTVYEGWMAPAIHDVTTDPDDPPAYVALAGRAPDANRFDAGEKIHYRGEYNTVSYMLHTYYTELTKPLALIMPPAKMFWRCFNAAKKMGWRIVDYSEKDGRIEATATSFWFGQVSDIVIRVRPAGTLGARFDMRTRSRSNERDFGRSLELMKAYRGTLAS
ncbi:MAG: DUF1499 domain-containing protein [Alphaproteobacteria bacterium]|nr:DUF1499 domain-containing protein [Alphaproteobacteria bacterium]